MEYSDKKEETKPLSKDNAGKVLKDFCESTSLHGYSYLYNSNSIAARILWFLVILITAIVAVFLTFTNTKEFMDAKINTNIETSSAPVSVSTPTFFYDLLTWFYKLCV